MRSDSFGGGNEPGSRLPPHPRAYILFSLFIYSNCRWSRGHSSNPHGSFAIIGEHGGPSPLWPSLDLSSYHSSSVDAPYFQPRHSLLILSCRRRRRRLRSNADISSFVPRSVLSFFFYFSFFSHSRLRRSDFIRIFQIPNAYPSEFVSRGWSSKSVDGTNSRNNRETRKRNLVRDPLILLSHYAGIDVNRPPDVSRHSGRATLPRIETENPLSETQSPVREEDNTGKIVFCESYGKTYFVCIYIYIYIYICRIFLLVARLL